MLVRKTSRAIIVADHCSPATLPLSSPQPLDNSWWARARKHPETSASDHMTWIVYILECIDGSLYTGITNDLERRMKAHTIGKGAKYTKRRGPFTVRYTEHHDSKSAALQREAAIKSLDRPEKVALISTGS